MMKDLPKWFHFFFFQLELYRMPLFLLYMLLFRNSLCIHLLLLLPLLLFMSMSKISHAQIKYTKANIDCGALIFLLQILFRLCARIFFFIVLNVFLVAQLDCMRFSIVKCKIYSSLLTFTCLPIFLREKNIIFTQNTTCHLHDSPNSIVWYSFWFRFSHFRFKLKLMRFRLWFISPSHVQINYIILCGSLIF